MQTQLASYLLFPADSAKLEVLGVEARVLAEDAHSSISRIVCPSGVGAPPHRHAQAENFFVLDGAVEVLLGQDWRRLEAGQFARIASGEVHAFRNPGNAPATCIVIATPGGHADFFRDADTLAQNGPIDREAAIALCERHGIELVL